MKRPYIFFLVILSIFSCRKIIPIDETYHQPTIVLNSTFSLTDDTISVYLTESQKVYGFHKFYKVVDNAQLSLYSDDVKIGDFNLTSDSILPSEYDPGYGAKYDIAVSNLDENATYGVSVLHPTMGEAYAETLFPSGVQIDEITLEVRQVMDYDQMVNALVANVTFTDPAGVNNYYQLYQGGFVKASPVVRYDFDEETGNSYALLTDTLSRRFYAMESSYDQIDPVVAPNENDIFGYTENQFMVFDDELIDGKSYTLQVVLKKYCDEDILESMDTTSGEYIFCDVGLRTITQDLYLYYRSLDAFYWNDGSPFAEPVQIFSNVDNGVGILSAYRMCNAKVNYGSPHPDKTYWDDVYY